MSDINTQSIGALDNIGIPSKKIVTTDATKKYLVIIGIIVALFLLGAFALFGGNTADKVVPATGTSQEGGGENVPAVGVVPEIPEPKFDNTFVPASECPPGEVLNEEGECEPKNKIPDEVGPVGEVEPSAQEEIDYTKYLYLYAEEGPIHGSYTALWEEIDGNTLRARVVSYEKGKRLAFEVGYLDNHKWVVYQRFDSVKEEIWKNGPNYRYPGYFTRESDSNYIAHFDTGFTVFQDYPTFKIDGGITYNLCVKKGDCKSPTKTAYCFIGSDPETIITIDE